MNIDAHGSFSWQIQLHLAGRSIRYGLHGVCRIQCSRRPAKQYTAYTAVYGLQCSIRLTVQYTACSAVYGIQCSMRHSEQYTASLYYIAYNTKMVYCMIRYSAYNGILYYTDGILYYTVFCIQYTDGILYYTVFSIQNAVQKENLV